MDGKEKKKKEKKKNKNKSSTTSFGIKEEVSRKFFMGRIGLRGCRVSPSSNIRQGTELPMDVIHWQVRMKENKKTRRKRLPSSVRKKREKRKKKKEGKMNTQYKKKGNRKKSRSPDGRHTANSAVEQHDFCRRRPQVELLDATTRGGAGDSRG